MAPPQLYEVADLIQRGRTVEAGMLAVAGRAAEADQGRRSCWDALARLAEGRADEALAAAADAVRVLPDDPLAEHVLALVAGMQSRSEGWREEQAFFWGSHRPPVEVQRSRWLSARRPAVAAGVFLVGGGLARTARDWLDGDGVALPLGLTAFVGAAWAGAWWWWHHHAD